MDAPPPLTRITRSEWERWPADRIRPARSPAVVWTGSAWAPCWVTGWCRVYNERFVRIRARRDVWRDAEGWYAFRAEALLPVEVDARDLPGWLPER